MEHDPNNQKKEFGPLVGAIIIVGLFIIGGIYFFLVQEPRTNEQLEDSTELPEAPADF